MTGREKQDCYLLSNLTKQFYKADLMILICKLRLYSGRDLKMSP